MTEVTFHVRDIEDMKAQMVRFLGGYGLQLAQDPSLTNERATEAAIREAQGDPAGSEEKSENPSPAQETAPAPAVSEAPKKRGRKPKAETVSAPAALPEGNKPEALPEGNKPADVLVPELQGDDEDVATEETARAALKDVSTVLGMEEARAMVLGFGADRFSSLKPEQYADFQKACRDQLAKSHAAS